MRIATPTLQGNVVPTITASYPILGAANMLDDGHYPKPGVVVIRKIVTKQYFSCAILGRKYKGEEQHIEISSHGRGKIANCITSVETDSMLLEYESKGTKTSQDGRG